MVSTSYTTAKTLHWVVPYRCAKISLLTGASIQDISFLGGFASLEGTGRHAAIQFKDKNTILSKPSFKLCKGFVTGTSRLMLVIGQASDQHYRPIRCKVTHFTHFPLSQEAFEDILQIQMSVLLLGQLVFPQNVQKFCSLKVVKNTFSFYRKVFNGMKTC